jgi:UDP-3-O-acyl-N-acetylglucosamine deacetylase
MFFSTSDKQITINNLLEFRGIGLHKAEIAYMIVDLYNKPSNSSINRIEQNFNSCPALYKTLAAEFEILNNLADKE